MKGGNQSGDIGEERTSIDLSREAKQRVEKIPAVGRLHHRVGEHHEVRTGGSVQAEAMVGVHEDGLVAARRHQRRRAAADPSVELERAIDVARRRTQKPDRHPQRDVGGGRDHRERQRDRAPCVAAGFEPVTKLGPPAERGEASAMRERAEDHERGDRHRRQRDVRALDPVAPALAIEQRCMRGAAAEPAEHDGFFPVEPFEER